MTVSPTARLGARRAQLDGGRQCRRRDRILQVLIACSFARSFAHAPDACPWPDIEHSFASPGPFAV